MRSVEEKLEHFNEVILKDAYLERNRILAQTKQECEERINSERLKLQDKAANLLRKESALSQNEKNSIVANAVIESKRLLIKTREDIINAVFNDTENYLRDYVNSNDYKEYLFSLIERSCKSAGDGELIVYITEKDMDRFSSVLEEFRQKVKNCIDFRIDPDSVIGGCRVLNTSKDILIDNTLKQKLDAQKDKFLEICGLEIV